MTKVIFSVNLDQNKFQMSFSIVPGILGYTLPVLIWKEDNVNSENNHRNVSLYFWKNSKINASGKSPNDSNEKGVITLKECSHIAWGWIVSVNNCLWIVFRNYFLLMCWNCKNVLEGFIGVMEISFNFKFNLV